MVTEVGTRRFFAMSPLLLELPGRTHGPQTMQHGEPAVERGSLVERAELPEVADAPALALLGLLGAGELVRDGELEPASLVEDEGDAPLEPHHRVERHLRRLANAELAELRSLQLELLRAFDDGLAQREAIGGDAQARAEGVDAGVGPLEETQTLAVLPHEAKDLVTVAGHRVEMDALVVDVAEGWPPDPLLLALFGGGHDGVGGEALPQVPAVLVLRVVRTDLVVGGEEGGEEVGELQVNRRRVVQGADGHGEEVVSRIRRLLGDAFTVEILPLDLAQAVEPAAPDAEEGVEHGGHKDLPAAVRLAELFRIAEDVRRQQRHRPAEGLAADGGHLLAHLLGEAEEDRRAHGLQ